MNRMEVKREKGKWFWYARDVRGRYAGSSHKGFSSRASCEHNASIVASGIRQGLALRNIY